MRAEFVTLILGVGYYCDVYLTHDSMSVRKAQCWEKSFEERGGILST